MDNENKKLADQILDKRANRSMQQLNLLNEKLRKKEITLEDIKAKLIVCGYSPDWVKNQSEDKLLSAYIDYHGVLDPTLKNSLAEMVSKKHEIEKSFLSMKKVDTGIHTTVATVIFAVALTLLIIALVSNPITGAGLILGLLSVGSVVISMALFGQAIIKPIGKNQP